MSRLILLISLLFTSLPLFAQVPEDFTVELSATVQQTPPRITLHWKPITVDTPVFYIYRKSKEDSVWGSALAVLPINSTSYTDPYVIADSAYEYQVIAYGSLVNSTGYIYAGISAPPIHKRGTILLLVDSTIVAPCGEGIIILMNDLSGDGWAVKRHDISRYAPDTYVKSIINSDYYTLPDVKAAFILGHLAVPYSGDFNPDGHIEHKGAWSADAFYACINGPWTDTAVNDISSSFPPNVNVPNDGKWDQTILPTPAMIELGRIDFSNMPCFPQNEAELTNNYLKRDHLWKMNALNIRNHALISDNFGTFNGQPFASNGWRLFPTVVGDDSIKTGPFLTNLDQSSFKWAYGCGPGCFTCCQGIGFSYTLIDHPVNAIFTQLFGSYFGDWNVINDFLRAPLCTTPQALTSCWAGRPNWFMHHMALGINIGYSTKLTQNNTGAIYQPTGASPNQVHIALMGDPSLRSDYIKPPSDFEVLMAYGIPNFLKWTASPDTSVIGYYLYYATEEYGEYKLLYEDLIRGTRFSDNSGISGINFYMVRPVKLQKTPSGNYVNVGIGIKVPVIYSPPTLQVSGINNELALNIFPNPAGKYLELTIDATISSKVTIYILNAHGQNIKSIESQLKQGENNISLNVEHLPAGNYEIIVETEHGKLSGKWIKL